MLTLMPQIQEAIDAKTLSQGRISCSVCQAENGRRVLCAFLIVRQITVVCHTDP